MSSRPLIRRRPVAPSGHPENAPAWWFSTPVPANYRQTWPALRSDSMPKSLIRTSAHGAALACAWTQGSECACLFSTSHIPAPCCCRTSDMKSSSNSGRSRVSTPACDRPPAPPPGQRLQCGASVIFAFPGSPGVSARGSRHAGDLRLPVVEPASPVITDGYADGGSIRRLACPDWQLPSPRRTSAPDLLLEGGFVAAGDLPQPVAAGRYLPLAPAWLLSESGLLPAQLDAEIREDFMPLVFGLPEQLLLMVGRAARRRRLPSVGCPLGAPACRRH